MGKGDKKPDTQKFAERDTGEAREQAAALLDTNRQYVSDAKKLSAEAPDLADRVKARDITIPQAKQEVNKRKLDRIQQ